MKVVVNIIGTQEINGEENKIEMTSVGQMKTLNGKTYIKYEDSASTGIEGVTATMKIDDDAITMQRSGGIDTKMYIEKGQRHLCRYETSEGIIDLGIFGEKVDNQLNEKGGRLSFSYTIDINHGLLSRNNIDLIVKPAD